MVCGHGGHLHHGVLSQSGNFRGQSHFTGLAVQGQIFRASFRETAKNKENAGHDHTGFKHIFTSNFWNFIVVLSYWRLLNSIVIK